MNVKFNDFVVMYANQTDRDLTGSIWRNTTPSRLHGVEPNRIGMHPGRSGQYSVVRFVVPFPTPRLKYILSRGEGDSCSNRTKLCVDFFRRGSLVSEWSRVYYLGDKDKVMEFFHVDCECRLDFSLGFEGIFVCLSSQLDLEIRLG